MKHFKVIDYSMKSIMHPSIKKAIQHSGLSDIELGLKLNVSRSTIFKWRTIENYKIRSSNIIALSKLLNKEPIFKDGYVSFDSKKINIPNEIKDNNMQISTDEMIKDLRKDKQILTEILEDKKRRIDELEKELQLIKNDESVLQNSTFKNIPHIDHTRLQIVISTKDKTTSVVSNAAAKYLGYTPLQMLRGSFKITSLLTEKDEGFCVDHSRVWIDPRYIDNKGFSYWRFKTKNDAIKFVRLETYTIGNEYVLLDAEDIPESEYLEKTSLLKSKIIDERN